MHICDRVCNLSFLTTISVPAVFVAVKALRTVVDFALKLNMENARFVGGKGVQKIDRRHLFRRVHINICRNEFFFAQFIASGRRLRYPYRRNSKPQSWLVPRSKSVSKLRKFSIESMKDAKTTTNYVTVHKYHSPLLF